MGLCHSEHELPPHYQIFGVSPLSQCASTSCRSCPGDPFACEYCSTYMLPGKTCAAEGLGYPLGCRKFSPHVQRQCSICDPGYYLTLDRQCVLLCPYGNTICGQHCLPSTLIPPGFSCPHWPMAMFTPPHPGMGPDPTGPDPAEHLNCSAGRCFACHPSCGKCAGPRESDCVTCANNNHVVVPYQEIFVPMAPKTSGYSIGTCQERCPAGHVRMTPGGANGPGRCIKCPNNCLECDPANPARCTRCHMGTFMMPDGSCGRTCPMIGHTYVAEGGRCEPCSADCGTCVTGHPHLCLSCARPDMYVWRGRCVSTCPDGFFPHMQTRQCRPCPLGCNLCANSQWCARCDPDFVLQNGQCMQICSAPNHFYDHQSNSCQPCSPNCKGCWRSADNCIACPTGRMFLKNGHHGSCHVTCPAGSHPDSPTTCDTCWSDNCLSCPDLKHCTKCADGFYLTPKKQCVAKCPTSYFEKHSTGECVRCASTCMNCDGSALTTHCTSCPNGNVLLIRSADTNKGECLVGCPPMVATIGTVRWHDHCLVCPANCAACRVVTGPGGHPAHLGQNGLPVPQCTSCKMGYTLHNGTCI
ncbi:hypothetical protein H696_05837 [Fonticula alba]|uniref:R-spondin Fu-CRD domain-containing protein n=1 Tax=Fonticula alba TaxID=691883 RepID=A0A058Z0C8_FONAL|nr:hypothetical protein H696_05837 [Fonticula alba]KCV67729.1 hypothetical protein H696_05837 [Fonticula alba]|eukprot:XP_009497913.1 hypothetical protein H696_05837 [Fonticula alba]